MHRLSVGFLSSAPYDNHSDNTERQSIFIDIMYFLLFRVTVWPSQHPSVVADDHKHTKTAKQAHTTIGRRRRRAGSSDHNPLTLSQY